jgi:hypothetical protein
MNQRELKRDLKKFLREGADWMDNLPGPEELDLNMELGEAEHDFLADRIARFMMLNYYIRKKRKFKPPRKHGSK